MHSLHPHQIKASYTTGKWAAQFLGRARFQDNTFFFRYNNYVLWRIKKCLNLLCGVIWNKMKIWRSLCVGKLSLLPLETTTTTIISMTNRPIIAVIGSTLLVRQRVILNSTYHKIPESCVRGQTRQLSGESYTLGRKHNTQRLPVINTLSAHWKENWSFYMFLVIQFKEVQITIIPSSNLSHWSQVI